MKVVAQTIVYTGEIVFRVAILRNLKVYLYGIESNTFTKLLWIHPAKGPLSSNPILRCNSVAKGTSRYLRAARELV